MPKQLQNARNEEKPHRPRESARFVPFTPVLILLFSPPNYYSRFYGARTLLSTRDSYFAQKILVTIVDFCVTAKSQTIAKFTKKRHCIRALLLAASAALEKSCIFRNFAL